MIIDSKTKRVVDCFRSDDYAGLEYGDYAFYYGYEETVPKHDLENGEWAFVADYKGNELCRLTVDDFKEYVCRNTFERLDKWNVEHVLLTGVGIVLNNEKFHPERKAM